MENSTATTEEEPTEEPPFTGVKYGEHCTEDAECDMAQHMQCRADHFFSRANKQHHVGGEEDNVDEEDFEYEWEKREKGLVGYFSSSKDVKKTFICNCMDGYAPTREEKGATHVMCKIGGGK
jgi:hypothetical protein